MKPLQRILTEAAAQNHFQRHLPSYGTGLFRKPNLAHAPFAQLVQEMIRTDKLSLSAWYRGDAGRIERGRFATILIESLPVSLGILRSHNSPRICARATGQHRRAKTL